jgi:hypothetical protein
MLVVSIEPLGCPRVEMGEMLRSSKSSSAGSCGNSFACRTHRNFERYCHDFYTIGWSDGERYARQYIHQDTLVIVLIEVVPKKNIYNKYLKLPLHGKFKAFKVIRRFI